MNPTFSRRLTSTMVAGSIFFIFLIAGTMAFSADPTILHLVFKDGHGQKVALSEATLVLVAGDYVDRLPLAVEGNGDLNLPMDPAWLDSHWPGGVSRLKNLDRAFVFLKAPGYALLCSDPIHWMGTEKGGKGDSMTVSFPRSKVMVVSKGLRNNLVVNLRKPSERFVKLTAGKGHPLEGVKVKTYAYWSKLDNGELNGADFLGEGVSGADGLVPVVDGDFTYAIQVAYQATAGHPARNVLVLKRFGDREYPVDLP